MIVAEEVEKERKREIKRKSREIYISLHWWVSSSNIIVLMYYYYLFY